MNRYLYPHNLKAKASLWLWSLKDFTILSVCVLLSAVILVELHWLLPAALSFTYGFLTIRMDDMTIMDFILYAFRYLISSQQYYEWR